MAEERGPEVGRLALRQEGGNWVAYYAPTGTMLGWRHLHGVRRRTRNARKRSSA
jgi:hypothetical protein